MIEIERRGAILNLVLARPAKRNAMSVRLVAELIAAFEEASVDETVGAVVLTGKGRGFCAGSDLAALAAMKAVERMQFETDSGRLGRLIGRCEVPVIAAVHGFAIGGGLTLAAACDVVVSESVARWSLPEVPIGLFPAWGIDAVTLRVGVARARRLCWGIDTISGTAAVAAGLADVIAEAPLSAATEIALRLAELPRGQARAVKRYFASRGPDESGDAAAAAVFLDASHSPEAMASFARFAGKRD